MSTPAQSARAQKAEAIAQKVLAELKNDLPNPDGTEIPIVTLSGGDLVNSLLPTGLASRGVSAGGRTGISAGLAFHKDDTGASTTLFAGGDVGLGLPLTSGTFSASVGVEAAVQVQVAAFTPKDDNAKGVPGLEKMVVNGIKGVAGGLPDSIAHTRALPAGSERMVGGVGAFQGWGAVGVGPVADWGPLSVGATAQLKAGITTQGYHSINVRNDSDNGPEILVTHYNDVNVGAQLQAIVGVQGLGDSATQKLSSLPQSRVGQDSVSGAIGVLSNLLQADAITVTAGASVDRAVQHQVLYKLPKIASNDVRTNRAIEHAYQQLKLGRMSEMESLAQAKVVEREVLVDKTITQDASLNAVFGKHTLLSFDHKKTKDVINLYAPEGQEVDSMAFDKSRSFLDGKAGRELLFETVQDTQGRQYAHVSFTRTRIATTTDDVKTLKAFGKAAGIQEAQNTAIGHHWRFAWDVFKHPFDHRVLYGPSKESVELFFSKEGMQKIASATPGQIAAAARRAAASFQSIEGMSNERFQRLTNDVIARIAYMRKYPNDKQIFAKAFASMGREVGYNFWLPVAILRELAGADDTAVTSLSMKSPDGKPNRIDIELDQKPDVAPDDPRSIKDLGFTLSPITPTTGP